MSRIAHPPLKDLTAACLTAGNRGWNRDALKRALNAFGATWTSKEITGCPVTKRRRLLSVLLHHPSWWTDQAHFFAILGDLGVGYRELCHALENLELPRPSMMDREHRTKLGADLQIGNSLVWREIRALRAQRQGATAEDLQGRGD
ncbi:MAG TPA: hypothetical protein PLA94_14635 [Myxococcota bacterium]|nr:hypothetical protein [Myxococcota bacterium]